MCVYTVPVKSLDTFSGTVNIYTHTHTDVRYIYIYGLLETADTGSGCVYLVLETHPYDAEAFEVVHPGLGLGNTSRQHHLLILLLGLPAVHTHR